MRNPRKKLESLKKIKDNWDHDGARKTSPQAIAIGKWLINLLEPEGWEPTEIVPTTDGGVQLEWHYRHMHLEVELDAEGKPSVLFEYGDNQ